MVSYSAFVAHSPSVVATSSVMLVIFFSRARKCVVRPIHAVTSGTALMFCVSLAISE